MKFLFVDDNDMFRAFLRETLVQPGDDWRELDDGAGVLAMYREFSPDWVVLDIRMKHVNGFAAAEMLKTAFPESRIVFISDFADEHFRARALRLGAAACLPKDNVQALSDFLRPYRGKPSPPRE